MPGLIHQTLHHYHILDKIGQGGMGIVYKAEDLKLHRIVALKFLPGYLAEDSLNKERFMREARMAAALDHPNIATVHDVVEDEDNSFIVMAYIEGETLEKRLGRELPSIEEALAIARQIAAALLEAHSHDIIHRDIKAANIMINSRREVKITDFGLAKLKGSSSITKTGSQVGTAAYMSPEVIQGGEADQRSDIFSFGVVMYQMLTGELPFTGENDQAVMFSIVYEDPPPIRQIRPEVPEALEQVVSRMLRKDPGERYQSAAEVADDLERFRKGAPVRASSPHSTPKLLRPAEFLSLPRVLLVAAVLLIAAGAFLWFRNSGKKVVFQERDWILVTDFENRTGETIFDETLDKAFLISIGQSRYINIFPRQRIRNSLRRMKLGNVERIDEKVGREIAVREGIKAILVPTISGVDNTYILTAEVINPADGEILTSAITYANSREKVLDALDKLTRDIRERLGETVAAISRQSRPLVHVTTASLEALKYYSIADQHLRKSKYEQARRYLESALQADSNFTAAKAMLGRMHYDLSSYVKGFDVETGKRLLSEAVSQVDSLTDLEKYGILAWYAQVVENDVPGAIRYTEKLLALYPDLSNVHNNLGLLYSEVKRYREAIKEFQTAIRLDPYLMIAYNNLSNVYMFQLGSEIDSARVWCRRQVTYNPDHFWAYYHLGWAYLGMDSLSQAVTALEKAYKLNNRWAIIPNFTWHLRRLGIARMLQKNYPRAIEIFLEINRINPAEPEGLYYAGIAAQLAGDEETARNYFHRFKTAIRRKIRQHPQNKYYRIQLALVLMRLGKTQLGWKMGMKTCEQDTTLHFERAQLYAVAGKPREAIAQLQASVRSGFRNYVWMKIHPDFLSLSKEPAFLKLVNTLLKRPGSTYDS